MLSRAGDYYTNGGEGLQLYCKQGPVLPLSFLDSVD